MAAGTTASNILLCACGKGDTTFTTSCSGLRNGCPSRGKCWGYILEWLRLPFSTYCPHCYHFTHYDTSLYVRRCRFGMRLLYLRWSCQKAKLHNVVVLPMSLSPQVLLKWTRKAWHPCVFYCKHSHCGYHCGEHVTCSQFCTVPRECLMQDKINSLVLVQSSNILHYMCWLKLPAWWTK